jgi:hypothetical protein
MLRRVVIEGDRRFRGPYRLHQTSETSANLYQTTRRNIPENNHIHTRRRENLKSQLRIMHWTALVLHPS